MRRTVIAAHFIVAMRLIALHSYDEPHMEHRPRIDLTSVSVRHALKSRALAQRPQIDPTLLRGEQIYE
jgi:hypothetical protein